MRIFGTIFFSLLASLSFFASAAEENKEMPDSKGDLNKYLIDITGGSVTASSLIGVDKSAVSQIQTSQDLVVAIQPFRSNDQKGGAGIAITPARTTITPISRETYFRNGIFSRMLGALTFSYAENSEEISKISYSKSAVSIDTSFYIKEIRDPIYIGGLGFQECTKQKEDENTKGLAAIYGNSSWNDAAKQEALEEHTKKLAEFLKPCIANYMKENSRWNDSRVSISYGQARIKSPGGSYETLGKYLTINAQIYSGPRSMVQLTARRIQDQLDVKTLGSASLGFVNSSLLAARFTYGDVSGTDMRGIVEVSNASRGSKNSRTDAFIYAIGVDKRIFEGAWLQFKLGRNRTLDSGNEQTTGILTFSIQPSLVAWKK